MTDLMTADDYAKHRGCSARAVRKAIADGRIEAQRDGRRWLIDAAAADRDWSERTDILRTHAALEPAPDAVEPDATEQAAEIDTLPPEPADDEQLESIGTARQRTAHWRARAMRTDAKLGEIELQLKTGILVEAAKVHRAQFSAARAFRDRMLNIPDRVAFVLAAETDAAVVHATLTKEIRDACMELAALTLDGEAAAQ